METARRSCRELDDRKGRLPAGTRTVAVLELFTGAAAVAGGVLLAVRPDGSLLMAKTSALAGSPFAYWRVFGAIGVGIAALVTRARHGTVVLG